MNTEQYYESSTKKKKTVSFRLDNDLAQPLKEWISKNRGFTFSTLANFAIREYISSEHKIASVEISDATDTEARKSMGKMLEQHKDAIDKLK